MARRKVITCVSCYTREYMEKAIEVELKTGDKIYFCCEHCKDVTSDEEILDKEIEDLIAERQEARKAKNFARADEIRDELLAKGIILKDTREGVKWKRA